ncbi:hypothetical protein D3C77_774940 [compost metagenome]
MDASLRFSRRHALHAMAAGFEFEFGVGTGTDDAHNHFLVAADFGRGFRHHFYLPAIAFGEARVHAQEITGKQG